MAENFNLKYITYQTFPANTANSLQTISNIKYFIKNGINVELIFPLRDKNSNSNLIDIQNFYGVNENFTIIGTKHNYPFGKIKYFNRILFLLSHFLWSKKISNDQIKILGSSSIIFTRSDWVFYFLSKKRVRVIYECHQFNRFRKSLINASLKNYHSKVIFLNENLKIEYEKKFNLNKNFIVLQNGVDLELFTKSKKKKGQIIFVGSLTRFNKSRNIEKIIEGLIKLNNEYKLLIVGAKDFEIPKLKILIDRYNLTKQVNVLPFMKHKKVIQHLLESEIGILINSPDNEHSTKFTSPIKYFEYLAADIKVIATNFDSHKILPFSNKISFFDYENVDSLINAILNTSDVTNINKEEKESISLDNRIKKIIDFCK